MFEGEDLGLGNLLKIWIVTMNSKWPFSFADRNLLHVDNPPPKKKKKIKQVRSFGVETSMQSVCLKMKL